MPTALTVSEVPALLQPGMTVFVQGSIGQPQGLMQALYNASSQLGGLRFITPLTPGMNHFAIGQGREPSTCVTFFDYKELRSSWQAGPIEFVPRHYSAIEPLLGRIDIGLIQLSPPDADGMCSTGLSADFVPDIVGRCDVVIAELNAAMPPVAGGPRVSLEQIDYAVAVDYPLPTVADPVANAVTDKIARNAAALIRDGDTLQFGVGRLPQLVVGSLGHLNDLGLHSGLISPVIQPLIEGGAMTGARKSIDQGLHVTGAVCGDAAFYDWIAQRPDFAFRPVSYTHDCRTLADLDNLVAINSVLEVDLFGQANAETAGGRQISGSGGLVDFVRGAHLSRGGRAIICLQSTSGGGKRSNIVNRLNGVVTICRTDLDIVVTEHGVAELADKSVEQRAEALIGVAAPEFRNQLAEQWRAHQQA
ncbi:acetyl-CoA hydrolase [Croceicoccus estronivorus]|uniref:acetyl-CoA hydrolase/transferase family protein n=1 Tax=Croceicoccus estronivorus TaxID=1172626 RepID=UPI00083229B9|nr:acetyl-CoA hydrolase/transferase C-terminal domain-containing protein [Croceicoccus estronivorus]OCC25613.1 acetyl-CoA hydrolase [Croceicoccus estronivorus]